MGVPAFFRWLSMKYPSIVAHCAEKRGAILDDDGNRSYVDASEPNPNGEEFDNLYLDMNGIIHPCTHPENKPAPKTESEMFVAIFEYIDRLFAIVRPRRVLYMAIDGVAPRAKMNQQRSRRFRAAKEAKEKQMTVERLRSELIARGAHLPPPKDEHFDSNCITPGTPFMSRLAVALRGYIYTRLTEDPGWRNLMVFLSDANVPGEGEHKIMDFIRRQRNNPTHDANTKHCLCGADADLIMLGLATHEPYFTIIREEFKPNQPKPCDLCGQIGHEMEDCVGGPREEDPNEGPPSLPPGDVDFIFIRLSVLRQYLADDLKLAGITFEWDLERVIDDWVFMCFFVGNDFLPHLPSLEIREGAIDRLIEIYKSTVQKTGGWLTDSGRVNLERVQLIMIDLGKMEDDIFKSRRESELQFRKRKRQNSSNNGYGRNQHTLAPQKSSHRPSFDVSQFVFMEPTSLKGRHGIAHPDGHYTNQACSAEELRAARRFHSNCQGSVNWVDRNLNNLEAATALKAMLKREKPFENGTSNNDAASIAPPKVHRGSSDNSTCQLGASSSLNNKPSNNYDNEDEMMDAADEVRFWEDGWRSRYYQSKFGVDPSEAPEFCLKVGQEYALGLCWVLAYYYQGCASWDWYFPYHYAPFASDFSRITELDVDFTRKETKPFRPLEQLMSVFPADSRSHVPPAWQDLMTDPDSPIIDFYPTNFKVDLNGKRYMWMGVALLPFVDEVRLLKALDSRRHLLTKEEVERNVRGSDQLFCRADHSAGPLLQSLYKVPTEKMKKDDAEERSTPSWACAIDPRVTFGITGLIWSNTNAYLPGDRVPSAVPGHVSDLKVSEAVSICFSDPQYPKGFVFPSKLLESVKMPPPVNLLPPQRGRGRGRGSFRTDEHHRRFNANAAMEYYARDNSDREVSGRDLCRNSSMNRMVMNSLPRYQQSRGCHSQYSSRSDYNVMSNKIAPSNWRPGFYNRFCPPPQNNTYNRDRSLCRGPNNHSYANPYSIHPPNFSTGLSSSFIRNSRPPWLPPNDKR
ncbi:5'-3' exoribonuclease 2 [Schistosoma japonicum]|nr:5'-3' exoribonuclease 2 [Schistosoma japonicum]